jgi:hypothetical protein
MVYVFVVFLVASETRRLTPRISGKRQSKLEVEGNVPETKTKIKIVYPVIFTALQRFVRFSQRWL